MRILKNLITDYYYANFTEDETEWTSGSLYDNADEVRDGHYIYKYARVDGTNTATSPSLNPLSWYKSATSNYFSMLGDRTSEKTTVSGNLIVEIDISNYDTLSLLRVTGTQVDIQVTDLDTSLVVYTDSKTLANTEDIIDAYSHYFSDFEYFGSYYNNQIPLVGNARIRIEITSLDGISEIGRLVCGKSYNVGVTLFGTTETLESYSNIETDEFGTTTLVPRNAVYNSSHSIRIPSSKIPTLKRKRKELDAIPVLFIGDEELNSKFENLLSYGLWENADITIQRASFSDMDLTIKELI